MRAKQRSKTNMLTKEQSDTIEDTTIHKLICALPGSGKTHTFISYVDRILKASPSNSVLMLTFTNASAKEMQDRINSRIGFPAAKRVKAATFASLMLKQFKQIANNRKVIIGAEQYTFVKRALAEAKVGYEEIDEWMSKIEELGREIDFTNDGTPSHRAFAAYCDILKRYKRYDLNMMARELYHGLSSGLIRPEPFTHFLIDEFQDTDANQYRWIAKQGELGKTLAVIGDDDQSIYGWRGALGYQAFVEFQHDFDAVGYFLSTCFRCKGNILHLAKGFIEHNEDRIDKDMKSIAEGEGKCVLHEIPKGFISDFTRSIEEQETPEILAKALEKSSAKRASTDKNMEHMRFVAQVIKQEGTDGWALLARTNKQLDEMEYVLSELDFDTIRIGGKSIFDNEHAVGIISLLMGITLPYSNAQLTTGLSWAGESEVVLHDIFISSQLNGFAGALPKGNSWQKYTTFFKELAIKAQHIREKNAEGFLKQFFKAIERIISNRKDKDEKLQLAVCDLCKSITLNMDLPLKDRVRLLDKRAQKNQSKQDIKDRTKVILVTLNSSKGLEFPRVWIFDLEDGRMPMLRGESIEEIESERRLLYVGMTRAEDELHLSYREGKASEFISEVI